MGDISIVYSGGTQNQEQQDSLGGFPSPVPVTDGKNNLFNDVTPQQTTQGRTDYRCFYVFNDNADLRYEIRLYIDYLNEVGSTLQVGILLQNEVQKLTFSSVPTGGSFTITIQGLKSDVITWDSDTETMASRIQTAIQSVTDCTVVSSSTHVYNITFKGILGNKSLSTLTITDNLLTPSPTVPTATRVTHGSPINTIAPDIGEEKTAPTGITFSSILTPGVVIGKLSPAEGFPVWIKRIVTPGFEAVENDGFNLQMVAEGELTD